MVPPSSLSLAAPLGGRPPTDRRSRIRGGKLDRATSLRFWRVAAALGVLAAVMLVDTASAAPRSRIVIAMEDEPERGFDPVTGWGSSNAPLIQSTLLKRNAALDLVGDLALKWTPSADGRQWTVQLRTDARFSDGKPLTADDVVFTFETTRKAAGTVDLTMLDSVRASGPAEVVFTLKAPRITFLNKLASLGIVPRHAYGPGYARKPVGSGPFKLLSWTQGQQAILEPNPYWHGPKPAFERITLLFLKEDATYAAARAGKVELAAIANTLAKQVPPGMNRLVVRSVDNRGLMFPAVPPGGKTAQGLPTGHAVTADPAVRRAINRALDRQRLVAGVLNGFGLPAWSASDNLPWDNAEQRLKDADLAGARAELAQAGWRDSNGNGVIDKNGIEGVIDIAYPAADSTRQGLALTSADMIRALGFKVGVVGKNWDDIKRVMHSQIVLFGWGSHDADEVASLYHSANAGRGFFNPGFFANPVVDGHIERAQRSATLAESLPHWRAAAWDGKTGYGMRADAAWAWLVNIDHVYFVHPCLDIGPRQIEPHGHGWGVVYNLEAWRWTCP